MRALFCVALGSGLLACTPDVATTTGAVGGAGGSTSSMLMNASSTTASTAMGSTTASSSTMPTSTNASTSASTTDASASSSDAASSSSSGAMPTNLPFCSAVTDTFTYASQADFLQTAITAGPFNSTGDVGWMAGMPTTTYQGGGQLGIVYLEDQGVAGSDCAWTVKLVDGGGGVSTFGYAGVQEQITLRYESGGVGRLRFTNGVNTDVPVPAYLAIVRINNVYFGAYRLPNQSQWTYITPLGGFVVPGNFPNKIAFGFSQTGNVGTTSTWDDFNVLPVSTDSLPTGI